MSVPPFLFPSPSLSPSSPSPSSPFALLWCSVGCIIGFYGDLIFNLMTIDDKEKYFIFKFDTQGTRKGELKEQFDVTYNSENQRILVVDRNNRIILTFDLD